MNPWNRLLGEVQRELDRLSQRVGERTVLPNEIEVELPTQRYDQWAPVLPELAAELGLGLCEWAARRGASWYEGTRPRLSILLTDIRAVTIGCVHRRISTPDE